MGLSEIEVTALIGSRVDLDFEAMKERIESGASVDKYVCAKSSAETEAYFDYRFKMFDAKTGEVVLRNELGTEMRFGKDARFAVYEPIHKIHIEPSLALPEVPKDPEGTAEIAKILTEVERNGLGYWRYVSPHKEGGHHYRVYAQGLVVDLEIHPDHAECSGKLHSPNGESSDLKLKKSQILNFFERMKARNALVARKPKFKRTLQEIEGTEAYQKYKQEYQTANHPTLENLLSNLAAKISAITDPQDQLALSEAALVPAIRKRLLDHQFEFTENWTEWGTVFEIKNLLDGTQFDGVIDYSLHRFEIMPLTDIGATVFAGHYRAYDQAIAVGFSRFHPMLNTRTIEHEMSHAVFQDEQLKGIDRFYNSAEFYQLGTESDPYGDYLNFEEMFTWSVDLPHELKYLKSSGLSDSASMSLFWKVGEGSGAKMLAMSTMLKKGVDGLIEGAKKMNHDAWIDSIRKVKYLWMDGRPALSRTIVLEINGKRVDLTLMNPDDLQVWERARRNPLGLTMEGESHLEQFRELAIGKLKAIQQEVTRIREDLEDLQKPFVDWQSAVNDALVQAKLNQIPKVQEFTPEALAMIKKEHIEMICRAIETYGSYDKARQAFESLEGKYPDWDRFAEEMTRFSWKAIKKARPKPR